MDARKHRRGRLGPPTFLRKKGEASLISRDALPVKRHRNPLGIFSRVFIYPLIQHAPLVRRINPVGSETTEKHHGQGRRRDSQPPHRAEDDLP
jgi:hypothetical protein